MRPALLLLALLALATPHRSAHAEMLVVLELHDAAKVGPEAASYLTDRIRAAALGAVGKHVRVVSREDVVLLLPPGVELVDCADAACEVDVGRRLGVDYVISGAVLRFDRALTLSIKLHATVNGALLASEVNHGVDVRGLEAGLPATIAALVAKLPGPMPTPLAPPIELPALPPTDVPAPPPSIIDFSGVDTALLDRVQIAHRLEADPTTRASAKAAAWRAVAARLRGEQHDKARQRAQQWQQRAEAEQRRTATARAAWHRYQAERLKLDQIVAYDDAIVSPAQKAEWRKAFDAAYAPWQEEFRRLATPDAGPPPIRDPLLHEAIARVGGDGPDLLAIITTTHGAITCRLFFQQTPKTVAHFAGLATGAKTWTHPTTGAPVRGQPFYEGLTFHRVIPEFMIQGGDPRGNGTGGPGFHIEDEFAAGLRHDQGGRLSLATTGPHTGGSQFIITEKAAPWLDGNKPIFGECKDLDVIRRIARVPAGPDNRPLAPVGIVEIAITWGRY